MRLVVKYLIAGVITRRHAALAHVVRAVLRVVGAGEAQGERGRRLGLDRQVREHVRHKWLLDEPPVEDAPVRRVKQRLGERLAHQRGAADRAVEARVVDHLHDGRQPSALFAEEPRPRALELDLARSVRAVAQLVLEALQADAVHARRRASSAAAESTTGRPAPAP